MECKRIYSTQTYTTIYKRGKGEGIRSVVIDYGMGVNPASDEAFCKFLQHRWDISV